MNTFRDNAGREWLVQVNVTAVKRCRAFLGIDLYKLVEDKFTGLAELLGDPVNLVDVVYVLCKDEAEKRGVTDEDFGRSMGGDSLERAAEAFLSALTDFFPDPRVRAGLKKVIQTSKTVTDKVRDTAAAEIDALDADSVARKLMSSFGISRASSGSTPDLSHSAS